METQEHSGAFRSWKCQRQTQVWCHECMLPWTRLVVSSGQSIIENITEAIYSSRKTVCVISRHYLQSEWCSREIQMARWGRCVSVLTLSCPLFHLFVTCPALSSCLFVSCPDISCLCVSFPDLSCFIPCPAFVCLMSRRTSWSWSFWRTSQPPCCLLTTVWGSWWRPAPTCAGRRLDNTAESSGRMSTELCRRGTTRTQTSSLDRHAKSLQKQRSLKTLNWTN